VEKRELWCIVDRNVNLYIWKTLCRCLTKLKIQLLYDPAITLLGIYPKEMKSVYPRESCTHILTAAIITLT
jgi:hypothetical protein